MESSIYVAFLRDALANAARVSDDGGVHYVCIDWRHVVEMITAARTVFGEMLNLAVWAKTSAKPRNRVSRIRWAALASAER